MFRFLAQKIKNRKWLMLCLVTGNVLLISVLCCITIYSDAIKTRILSRRMNTALSETGEYPMKLNLNAVLVVVDEGNNNAASFEKMRDHADSFIKTKGIVKESVELFTVSTNASTVVERNGKSLTSALLLGRMSALENHIKITSGDLYSARISPPCASATAFAIESPSPQCDPASLLASSAR